MKRRNFFAVLVAPFIAWLRHAGYFADCEVAPSIGLRETMSVSDYRALYVDVLDRMFYGYYLESPQVDQYIPVVSTTAFRNPDVLHASDWEDAA